MILPRQHNLQVQHDPQLRLMRFQWVGGPDSQAVRADLMYGRDLVMAQQPTHVLVDLAGLPPLEMQDELWMTVHWFPKIAASRLQYVALVLRPGQLHNQMAIEAMLWLGRQLMRFQMQVFESVSGALDWLTQGEAGTMHRLQTEWHEHAPRAGQPAAGVCNLQPGPGRSFAGQ